MKDQLAVQLYHEVFPKEAMHAIFDVAEHEDPETELRSDLDSETDGAESYDVISLSSSSPTTTPLPRAAQKSNSLQSPLVCMRSWPNGKRDEYVGSPDEWAASVTGSLELVDGSFVAAGRKRGSPWFEELLGFYGVRKGGHDGGKER